MKEILEARRFFYEYLRYTRFSIIRLVVIMFKYIGEILLVVTRLFGVVDLLQVPYP